MKPDELKACIGEYHGLVIRSATKATAEIIEAAKNLKVIGRAGSGLDNVDKAAASKRYCCNEHAGRQYDYNSRAYNCPFIFTCETGPAGDCFYEGRAMGKEKNLWGLSSSTKLSAL